tara:strand:+ start:4701 stop:5477 length:777 start_codon:yes stop_codon:yes gene_type:complete
MRKIPSLFFLALISSCYFNSIGHREIVEAQKAIDSQKFKAAEKKLESALRSDLSLKLKVKALHQLGVVKAFHLNDLYGALEVFKQTYEIADTSELKAKSSIYLADLYFNMLRDYGESAPLYKNLYNFEKEPKLKEKYFSRYIKSLFEIQKFTEVVINLKDIKISNNNFTLIILKSMSLYFLSNIKKAKSLLNKLEVMQGITRDQLSEVKFFKGLIFEEQQELKLSYNEYLDIYQFFPNSSLIKLRIERLIHRKKSSKR